ncbi:MAG: carboxylesterase/lipase family protein, partial [Firmicutes bacterium]|nr:carboxylesterase/lipase family protein [Bacillota bacterium]
MQEKLMAFCPNGRFEGVFENGVCVWKGIPYARPPIGNLRFAHARPLGRYKGIFKAVKFGPRAPQTVGKGMWISENCLNLNIWSQGADKKRRPVLFFIHGGAFVTGAGSDDFQDGAYLARTQDVVMVTVNYRLGALGFSDFSFVDKKFRANCGLSDIIEALRWTKRNISAFGGDPENITVFGQSAGGTISIALTYVEQAKGLFSRIISMSGGPTLLVDRAAYRNTSREFLRFAGIRTAEELKTIPAVKLASFQKSFAKASGFGVSTF